MLILAAPPHLTKCLFHIIWAPCIHFLCSSAQWRRRGSFQNLSPLRAVWSGSELSIVLGLRTELCFTPMSQTPGPCAVQPTWRRAAHHLCPRFGCVCVCARECCGCASPILKVSVGWWERSRYSVWIPWKLRKWAAFHRARAESPPSLDAQRLLQAPKIWEVFLDLASSNRQLRIDSHTIENFIICVRILAPFFFFFSFYGKLVFQIILWAPWRQNHSFHSHLLNIIHAGLAPWRVLLNRCRPINRRVNPYLGERGAGERVGKVLGLPLHRVRGVAMWDRLAPRQGFIGA